MEGQAVTILLLGDEKCGKTTFLSDVDQPFVFEVRSRNNTHMLEFYDTASPGDWRQLKPDVVVICYDWVKEVRANFEGHDSLPMLLLGLKRDLRCEDDPGGVVYPQEGHLVAQEMRADKYMECSAVTGELLHDAFEDICSTAIKTTQQGGGQSEGACSLM